MYVLSEETRASLKAAEGNSSEILFVIILIYHGGQPPEIAGHVWYICTVSVEPALTGSLMI